LSLFTFKRVENLHFPQFVWPKALDGDLDWHIAPTREDSDCYLPDNHAIPPDLEKRSVILLN